MSQAEVDAEALALIVDEIEGGSQSELIAVERDRRVEVTDDEANVGKSGNHL
jgi:hypothetical protein